MTQTQRLPSKVSCLSRHAAFQNRFSPYLQFMLEKDALFSPSTKRWYQQSLTDFFNFADWFMELGGKEVPSEDITKILVLAWIKHLQAKMSDVSVNTKYRALRAYLNWLVAEKYIEASPIVQLPAPKYLKVGSTTERSRNDLARELLDRIT